MWPPASSYRPGPVQAFGEHPKGRNCEELKNGGTSSGKPQLARMHAARLALLGVRGGSGSRGPRAGT